MISRLPNLSTRVALLALALGACSHPRPAPITAALSPSRVDSFQLTIPELGDRARTVRVYLPPGYASAPGAFPVLYLQDAQQLFTRGWFGDWRVDETVDSLVASGHSRGIIVVGVDNGPRRWDEYGPWVNRHMRDWIDSSWAKPVQGGEGSAYVGFVATTLKPRIDRQYRTLADRAHTGIGGSRMGGLIAIHAGLTRPDIEGAVQNEKAWASRLPGALQWLFE